MCLAKFNGDILSLLGAGCLDGVRHGIQLESDFRECAVEDSREVFALIGLVIGREIGEIDTGKRGRPVFSFTGFDGIHRCKEGGECVAR